MCKAFSCLVLPNKDIVWKFGVDSHEDLLKIRPGLKDDTDDRRGLKFARCELSPKNGNYLKPCKWVFRLDESIKPDWFNKTHEGKVRDAWKEWKKELDSVLIYKEIIHPFEITPPKIAKKHKDLVCLWNSVWNSVRDSVWDSVWNSVRDSVWDSVGDSVWNSVRDSVWNSVRDSVWDSVGDSVWDSVRDSVWNSVRDSVWDSVRDSVWAYVGSFFSLKRDQWKYTENIKTNKYPFQPAVDLWEMGLVPSFDGKIWRLHGGKKAGILWEG